jgi:hypothetical protein
LFPNVIEPDLFGSVWLEYLPSLCTTNFVRLWASVRVYRCRDCKVVVLSIKIPCMA